MLPTTPYSQSRSSNFECREILEAYEPPTLKAENAFAHWLGPADGANGPLGLGTKKLVLVASSSIKAPGEVEISVVPSVTLFITIPPV